MRKMMIMLFTLAMTLPMAAQEDTDMGLWMTAGAQKKINKQWSVTGEAEYRLRDDFSASDRWTIGLSTTYKPYKWLKLHAGYKFMRDNNEEEYSYHKDGSVNKYTPSYWNTKHRLYAGATGTLKMNNWNLSLRERWQYTLKRPTTVQRYDEDDEAWEDKEKKGGGKNVLRSRLQLSYDFKSVGIEPFVSAELYNQRVDCRRSVIRRVHPGHSRRTIVWRCSTVISMIRMRIMTTVMSSVSGTCISFS